MECVTPFIRFQNYSILESLFFTDITATMCLCNLTALNVKFQNAKLNNSGVFPLFVSWSQKL